MCEPEIASFRLSLRFPGVPQAHQPNVPVSEIRVEFMGSDCVAAETVVSDDWYGFVNLFGDIHTKGSVSRSWVSKHGEWRLDLRSDPNGKIRLVSVLDGLRDYNHWAVTTDFHLTRQLLRQNYLNIKMFVGACGRSTVHGLFPYFDESIPDFAKRLNQCFDRTKLNEYDRTTFDDGLEWASLPPFPWSKNRE